MHPPTATLLSQIATGSMHEVEKRHAYYKQRISFLLQYKVDSDNTQTLITAQDRGRL